MSRHLERLTAVAVAPNARAVAAAGFRDKKDAPPVLLEGISASIHVFQIGKSVKEGYEGALGDRQVCSLAFGETRLYAGTEDGSILSFDPSSDDRAPTAERRGTAAVSALVVHGNRLYAADVEGFVRTFAATTLEPGPSRRVAEGAQASLTVGHDHLIVGGTDGVARALPLDALDGDLREMPLSTAAVTALTTTEDGRVLAGLADGTVFLCFLEGAVDAEERSAGAPHENTVHGIALLPRLEDEKGQKLPARFLSLSEDGALKSWELDSKRRPKTSQTSAGAAGLALLPPTKTMRSQHKAGIAAVVSGERTLHLFELDAQGNAAPFHKALSRFSELGQSLRARAANVREAAVRELGALPEDYARTQLERVLGSDRDASIRAFTASVLGEGMRRLSRPALQKALSESNPDVRAAAFASLRQIDVDAPLSPVRAALLSSHWDVRAEAVELLPSLRSASPLVPGLIADALRDGEAKVRDQAFEALFALDAPGSLEPIVTAMRHGPEDVRVQALIRLAGLLQPDSTSKSHDGRDILERALDDDADTVRKTAFFVAVALQSALAGGLSIRDPEARKALAKIAHQAGVPVGSAGPELTDRDKQPLFAALAARSSDSALLGARALGILGDRRAPGALLSLSREPDVALRRRVVDAIEAAAYALPEDERLVAHLEWLLDDDDAQTRQRAFDALDRIGAPAGPAAALELAGLALRCKFYDIRLRALPILTGFGGRGKWAGLSQLSRRADELLSDGLDDEREKVRSEAFRTLWSWHEKAPREPLERAAGSRHPDIRSRAASELGRIKDTWADELLIVLARDTDATVGLTAFETFRKKSKEHDNDVRIFLALLQSPRPELKARATREVPAALRDEVLSTIVALVRDDHPTVHIAAIEAVDRLKPDDITAFQEAFASVFYRLRVRAGELLGKRRDERAIAPMEALLSIPKEDIRYPSEELRRKAAAALADVGARKTLSFLTALLEEDDGYINEQGARGLATAARPGDERVLLDALDHKELAVRSWAAEGLARLGDVRAIPVLAGSLAHDHRPIRLGAILGYVALGADGVRGILAGLDDGDREIADLCFAVVVARDLGLRRAELPPDLLLSVLGSAEPELRFSAARLLEAREDLETLESIASGLVGPATPARAADMKNWPKEPRRVALTRIVVDALGSDHPAQRYAATQVLALRKKPLAFWREAARLQGPALSPNLRIPHTNWDLEPAQPQKRGWVRRLFSRPERAPAEPGTGRVLEVISFIGGRTARAV
ncbi:MAG: HEAT repeat domain-containing protein, partial [Myxococcota bacterium]